jgi:cytochrome c biogenesis protein CcmG, thiol:disulfide interchange protein DsbE
VSRGRWAGLAAVLVLLLGALTLGARDSAPPAPATPAAAPGLDALRARAALGPCPTGLSPALPDLVLPCVGAPGAVRIASGGPGRPTVVNVWGTWCPPCVREVPLLQQLHTRTDAVDVVGVLTQDTAEQALQFADDPSLGFDMTYPSVQDDSGRVMRAFGPGPPITLFVTADGRIAHRQVGEMTSGAQLDGLVRRHLGVTV